jgi:2-iminobutanoate/2-iminopropanoate deaminase
MIKQIYTEKAPKPVGPYSQAVLVENLIFVSGQLGINEEGKLVEGIEAQTKQALTNIKNILESQGCDLSNVVKVTVYLKDISHFSIMNKVYSQFFSPPYPARTTVKAELALKDALVEIDAIAYCKK